MIEQPQDAKLLGGQKSWDTCNRAVSSKLEALGMTDEEVTQIHLSDEIHNKIAQLYLAARPGAKSATTPEIAALIPKGWTVVEDVLSSLFRVRELEFVSFLRSGEEYVNGEIMRSRATKLGGNFGLADAAFLIENQALIPTEFQGTAYIAFPGTLLRGSDGDLCVPCLHWGGDRWLLYFHWLDHRWYSHDRLVSCKEELGALDPWSAHKNNTRIC